LVADGDQCNSWTSCSPTVEKTLFYNIPTKYKLIKLNREPTLGCMYPTCQMLLRFVEKCIGIKKHIQVQLYNIDLPLVSCKVVKVVALACQQLFW